MVAAQPAALRVAELVTGGANGLVRLLSVLDPLLVPPGGGRQVVTPVQVAHDGAGGRQGLVGQRRAVGTHVGDVPGLIEILGHPHRAGSGKAQLAPGLLLERGGEERGIGRAPPGFFVDTPYGELGRRQPVRQSPGAGLVQPDDVGPAQLAVVAEIPSRRQAGTVKGHEHGTEPAAGGPEAPRDVPVGGGPEAHASALALDQQACRHRLDPSCGKAWEHLAPQHGADLVAVEAVEDPSRLLGVH